MKFCRHLSNAASGSSGAPLFRFHAAQCCSRCCRRPPPGQRARMICPWSACFLAPESLRPDVARRQDLARWAAHRLSQGARRTTRTASTLGPSTSPGASIAGWSYSARWPAPTSALSRTRQRAVKRQRTAARSGIVEYSFAPDSHELLIRSTAISTSTTFRAKPADAVRRLTTTAAYETDARFSPHSHFVTSCATRTCS